MTSFGAYQKGIRWGAAAGALLLTASAAGFACTGNIGEAVDSDGVGGATGAGPGATSGSQGQTVGSTSGSQSSGNGGAGQGSAGAGGATSASVGAGGSPTEGAGGSQGSAVASSSASSSTSAGAGGGSPVDMLCSRWKADRADLGEGVWSGSVNGCNPGDVTADGRANAVKIVNLYRFIAGLPPVTNDATRDMKAQSCALMMTANNQLNHFPPANWTCYSADGAEAAGKSNIATTAGVAAVDLYMADPGNPTTIGHRRWILSGSLGPIGVGTTSSYSCMWVIGGSGAANQPYTAWPSAGLFPIQAMNASFSGVDANGWTVQSDSIDLTNATVTITDGGQNKPVMVSQLLGGYGSSYAIRILPQGWTSQAGHTYSVNVAGIAQPFSYDVEMVSCN